MDVDIWPFILKRIMDIDLLTEFVVPYLENDSLRALACVSQSFAGDVPDILNRVRNVGLHYESPRYTHDFKKDVQLISEKLELLHTTVQFEFVMKAYYAACCLLGDDDNEPWISLLLYDKCYDGCDDIPIGCKEGIYKTFHDACEFGFLNNAKAIYDEFGYEGVGILNEFDISYVLNNVCLTSQNVHVAQWLHSLLPPEEGDDVVMLPPMPITFNKSTTPEFLDWALPIYEENNTEHSIATLLRKALVSMCTNIKEREDEGKVVQLLTYIVNRHGLDAFQYNNAEEPIVVPFHIVVCAAAKHPNVIKWVYENLRRDSDASLLSEDVFEHVFDVSAAACVDLKADVHTWLQTPSNVTLAFVSACASGHLFMLEWLNANYGYQMHGDDGRVELCYTSAGASGHIHVLKWLNANFDIGDAAKEEAFAQACDEGHVRSAAYLYKQSHFTVDHERLFFRACVRHHFKMAMWLAQMFRMTKCNLIDPVSILICLYRSSNHVYLVKWFKETFEFGNDESDELLHLVRISTISSLSRQ